MNWLSSRNSANSSSVLKRSIEDEQDDDDAQLLLPTKNGFTHKRIQRVKHSVSYLVISSAAAFTLVMMVWLGPGLVKRDPKGIASQSNAHVGYSEELSNNGNLTEAVIPVSSTNTTTRPKLSVTQPPPEPKVLPHHSWNPLLYDPAPITHVYVKPCMFPPWAFKMFCTPSETAKEIALYGKWVRVPRDLSKGVGHYYTEIYYRRAQTLDLASLNVKPITALRILDEDDLKNSIIKSELERDAWDTAGEGLRTGVWPTKLKSAHLWYTRSTNLNGTHNQAVRPINEISVIWSPKSDLTRPWWGFERLDKPVFDGDNEMDHIQCDIAVRRDLLRPPSPPSLTFQKDGRFKIMQISDLHFSASGGECQSANGVPSCEKLGADTVTMEWLTKAILEAKPDLIVLGGDQLLGSGNTFDTISTLTKIGHFFADIKIPWTAVFGNHDADKSLAIEEQMYLLKHMPYFIGRAGPGVPGFDEENLPPVETLSDMGVGNYVLKVNASESDPTQLLSLYFLDSHDYPRTTLTQIWELAMGGSSKYDWLKKSQVEWYRRESEQQPRVLRPFQPTDEYRQKLKSISSNDQAALSKPLGMMFFHIPLPEAYDRADVNTKTGGELVSGNQREKSMHAEDGDQFFQKAILTTSIRSSISQNQTFEPEIKVIANGHAHMTDTCRRHQGVYHCFSGLSSYSGSLTSSSVPWERRVRVFEIESFGETIKTFQLKHSIDGSRKSSAVRFGSTDLYNSADP